MLVLALLPFPLVAIETHMPFTHGIYNIIYIYIIYIYNIIYNIIYIYIWLFIYIHGTFTNTLQTRPECGVIKFRQCPTDSESWWTPLVASFILPQVQLRHVRFGGELKVGKMGGDGCDLPSGNDLQSLRSLRTWKNWLMESSLICHDLPRMVIFP